MVEFFVLLLICGATVLGGGFLIHYFWLLPLPKAFGRAAFFVGMFLLFWASGLWIGVSRHSWGVLTPILMAMIALSWLCIKYGPRIFRWAREKLKDDKIE